MNKVNVLRIVVASPGDVEVERNHLNKVAAELNRGVAADRGLRLRAPVGAGSGVLFAARLRSHGI